MQDNKNEINAEVKEHSLEILTLSADPKVVNNPENFKELYKALVFNPLEEVDPVWDETGTLTVEGIDKLNNVVINHIDELRFMVKHYEQRMNSRHSDDKKSIEKGLRRAIIFAGALAAVGASALLRVASDVGSNSIHTADVQNITIALGTSLGAMGTLKLGALTNLRAQINQDNELLESIAKRMLEVKKALQKIKPEA